MVSYEARPGRSLDFAEHAEALGINTDDIFAVATEGDNVVVVLYTRDAVDKPPVWLARLGRDADGVFVTMGEPELFAGGEFWDDARTAIERRLHERYGPPDDEKASP